MTTILGALLSALISGTVAATLFYLQGRRDRRRLADAWQSQAEQLHRELSGQYQKTIDDLREDLRAKDRVIDRLTSRDQP